MTADLFRQDYLLADRPVVFGKTTCQLLAAPLEAIYVWVNAHLQYPRQLACYLGRTDLSFIAPSHLHWGVRRFHLPFYVIDHALWGRLTEDQFAVYRSTLQHLRECHAFRSPQIQVPQPLLGHGLFRGSPDRGPSGESRLCHRDPVWDRAAWLERSACGPYDQLLRDYLASEREPDEDRSVGPACGEQCDG